MVDWVAWKRKRHFNICVHSCYNVRWASFNNSRLNIGQLVATRKSCLIDFSFSLGFFSFKLILLTIIWETLTNTITSVSAKKWFHTEFRFCIGACRGHAFTWTGKSTAWDGTSIVFFVGNADLSVYKPLDDIVIGSCFTNYWEVEISVVPGYSIYVRLWNWSEWWEGLWHLCEKLATLPFHLRT